MLVHFARTALVVLLLASIGVSAAPAQTSMGGVNGTVTDSQGGVLPGATVTFVDVESRDPNSRKDAAADFAAETLANRRTYAV